MEKSNPDFSTVPTALGNPAKDARFPHFPSHDGGGYRLPLKTKPAKIAGPVRFLRRATVGHWIISVLPGALIITSLLMVFQYHSLFRDSLVVAQAESTAEKQGGELSSAYLREMRSEYDRKRARDLAARFMSYLSWIRAADNNTVGATAVSVARIAVGEKGDIGAVSSQFLESCAHCPPSELRERSLRFVGDSGYVASEAELREMPSVAIPFASTLMAFYLAIFLSAEAAFVLMATKEYLQELLGLTDSSLIR